MKITELVEALVAAKATPEAILAAVRVAEAQQTAASEASKEKARARVQRWKDNHPDRNVSKRSETFANVPQRLTSGGAPVEEKPLPQKVEEQEESKLVAKARASRIPSDFSPDLGWAVGQGLTLFQAQTEAAKFRDFWTAKAGKDAAKLDWPATWRNWVRQALERLPPSRAGPSGAVPKTSALADSAQRIVTELRQANELRSREGSLSLPAPLSNLSVVSGGRG